MLSRLGNTCAKIGGNAASKLASVACPALELLFTLEREQAEPYLGMLWESSRSEGSLPPSSAHGTRAPGLATG